MVSSRDFASALGSDLYADERMRRMIEHGQHLVCMEDKCRTSAVYLPVTIDLGVAIRPKYPHVGDP